MSLNFSSASGDGFLSGWYYIARAGECQDLAKYNRLFETMTLIACLRYAFFRSVSFTSGDTPSCYSAAVTLRISFDPYIVGRTKS